MHVKPTLKSYSKLKSKSEEVPRMWPYSNSPPLFDAALNQQIEGKPYG